MSRLKLCVIDSYLGQDPIMKGDVTVIQHLNKSLANERVTINPFTKTLVGLLSHGNLPHVGAEKRGYIMTAPLFMSNARLSYRRALHNFRP